MASSVELKIQYLDKLQILEEQKHLIHKAQRDMQKHINIIKAYEELIDNLEKELIILCGVNGLHSYEIDSSCREDKTVWICKNCGKIR